MKVTWYHQVPQVSYIYTLIVLQANKRQFLGRASSAMWVMSKWLWWKPAGCTLDLLSRLSSDVRCNYTNTFSDKVLCKVNTIIIFATFWPTYLTTCFLKLANRPNQITLWSPQPTVFWNESSSRRFFSFSHFYDFNCFKISYQSLKIKYKILSRGRHGIYQMFYNNKILIVFILPEKMRKLQHFLQKRKMEDVFPSLFWRKFLCNFLLYSTLSSAKLHTV